MPGAHHMVATPVLPQQSGSQAATQPGAKQTNTHTKQNRRPVRVFVSSRGVASQWAEVLSPMPPPRCTCSA
jgi:hypothetical protein